MSGVELSRASIAVEFHCCRSLMSPSTCFLSCPFVVSCGSVLLMRQ